MTMNVGAIKATFEGDSHKLTRSADESAKALLKVKGTAEHTAKALGKTTAAADATAAKASTLAEKGRAIAEAFGPAAAIITAAAGALNKLYDAAAKNVGTMAQAAAFEKLGGSVDHLSERFRGLVDGDTTAQLGMYAKGLGLSSTQTDVLAEASRDLARAMNTDVKTAFDSMALAVTTGNKKGLQGVGVLVDFVAAEERFAKALGVTKDALTEKAKIQSHMLELEARLGPLREAAATDEAAMADNFDRASVAGANLMDTLEDRMTPAFADMAGDIAVGVTGLNELVNAIDDVATYLLSTRVATAFGMLKYLGMGQIPSLIGKVAEVTGAGDGAMRILNAGRSAVAGLNDSGGAADWVMGDATVTSDGPLVDRTKIKKGPTSAEDSSIASLFKESSYDSRSPAVDAKFTEGMKKAAAAADRLAEATEVEIRGLYAGREVEDQVIRDSVGHTEAADAAFMKMVSTVDGLDQTITDLRSPLEKFGSAVQVALVGLAGAAATVVAGGFQAGGAELGGVVGGIVDAATGGATGGLGAVLGSILGGVLGNALDSLVGVLGVLTPLFDGVAVVIDALQPVLLVVKELMGVLGQLLIDIAPIILAVAKPLAALLLVVVRLVQILMPLVGTVLLVAAGLVMLADFVTGWVRWADQGLREAVNGVRYFYNGLVEIINKIISWLRVVTTDDKFGTKMEKMNDRARSPFEESNKARVEAIKDARDAARNRALDANTEELKTFNRTMTNIPSSYRLPIYAAEAQNGAGAGGVANGGGNVIVHGSVTVVAQSGSFLDAMRRELMQKRGRPTGGARGGNDDQRN